MCHSVSSVLVLWSEWRRRGRRLDRATVSPVARRLPPRTQTLAGSRAPRAGCAIGEAVAGGRPRPRLVGVLGPTTARLKSRSSRSKTLGSFARGAEGRRGRGGGEEWQPGGGASVSARCGVVLEEHHAQRGKGRGGRTTCQFVLMFCDTVDDRCCHEWLE